MQERLTKVELYGILQETPIGREFIILDAVIRVERNPDRGTRTFRIYYERALLIQFEVMETVETTHASNETPDVSNT